MITDDEKLDVVLKVLRTEKEREKMVGADKNEDCHGMDDSIKISATDQDEYILDEAGRSQAPMDEVGNVLKILVHKEFSFISRDVYDGILSLPQTKNTPALSSSVVEAGSLKGGLTDLRYRWIRSFLTGD